MQATVEAQLEATDEGFIPQQAVPFELEGRVGCKVGRGGVVGRVDVQAQLAIDPASRLPAVFMWMAMAEAAASGSLVAIAA